MGNGRGSINGRTINWKLNQLAGHSSSALLLSAFGCLLRMHSMPPPSVLSPLENIGNGWQKTTGLLLFHQFAFF